MIIIGKEYRTLKPIEILEENDVQGGSFKILLDVYILIHDKMQVAQFTSDYDENDSNIFFGNIPQINRDIQIQNLRKTIEKNNLPALVGNYCLLDLNKIEMKWNYYYGEPIELIFKGEILLNGDAIKGTFYKNGEVNVFERVYYNIDKPLPENLIEENDV